MTPETSGPERKSKFPILRLKAISRCAVVEKVHWFRECPWLPSASSLEPSFTPFDPKAEVAAVNNRAVLAADDDHNFLTLKVRSLLLNEN